MTQKIPLFGMEIDRITLNDAVVHLESLCCKPMGTMCAYVVTPNVDHAVMFQKRQDLRTAYSRAAMVLADGAPLVWASRLLKRSLPERVAGSDLVPKLLAYASDKNDENTQPMLRTYLLGAAPGVANQAAKNIERQWPGVRVVGTLSPPLGFENNPSQTKAILAAIADVEPDLLIVGLGAPKQELWVSAHADHLRAKVALCVGATIDFIAGHRRRSPVWMRRCGLEWLFRILCEPRRLWKRYAKDAIAFPKLFWREWRDPNEAKLRSTLTQS